MRTKIPLIAAVVAALVVPGASALAQHRMGSVSNHAAIHSGAVTHQSFNRGTRFSGTRFSGTRFRSTRFARSHNGRFFRHHRHFRGPFFTGAFAYADSCWRWHWTPFGLRRHWVCDYDPYW
jgi:hypothetical protein